MKKIKNILLLLCLFPISAFTQEIIRFKTLEIKLPKAVVKISKPNPVKVDSEEERLTFSKKFSEFSYGRQLLNLIPFELNRDSLFLDNIQQSRANRIRKYDKDNLKNHTDKFVRTKKYNVLIMGDFSVNNQIANVFSFFAVNKTSTLGVSCELKFLPEDRDEAEKKIFKILERVNFH